MTISHRLRGLVVAVAALSAFAAAAQKPCPATPAKYRDVEFGDVRFAIEEGCSRSLTQHEQFFVAGIAQALLVSCKLPRDRDGRAAVERFTNASTLAFSYLTADAPLGTALSWMSASVAAFAAGKALMEDVGCKGPEAALLSRGIVNYLRRTSANSRFVAGCVEFYGGRYNAKQCQCIAENLRGVFPDIDQRYFQREIIKESIHQSPFIAAPLMLSCGMGNY
ncbi:MAG TPA: hypothetical protein VF618_12360 [Thermoanaerobaculia bacterium]